MKENYYLDNAATTWPKPEPVYQFMDSFFRSHGVNPGRAGHQLAVEAEHMIVDTRRMLAQFFNFEGDTNRMVFTQNATDSLNMTLFGLLNAGDHLITTRLEHNSVVRPANHLERDHGVEVTRVGRDSQGYVDPDDIRKAIKPNTKVVLVNHASNVLGAVQDLEAIGKIVAESDALFVIDTAQTAGVVSIDMQKLGVDVLTFTGHKGLFGPMGIGGLLVGEHVDIRAARVGGTGVDSITPFQPDTYPHHLEAGTVSIPGIAGLHAAQVWFADLGREKAGTGGADLSHWDACNKALEHIHAHELGCANRLLDAFQAMDKIIVYGPTGNGPRVATMTINIEGMLADQAGAMLDADHALCVRAGLHCAPHVHEDDGTVALNGSIRIAPGYFTDDEDVQQTIEGVADIAEVAVP